MSNEDSSGLRFFNDLHVNLKNQRDSLGQINSNLRHYNLEEISEGHGGSSLEKQFRENPEGFGAFGPVESFIQHSLELSGKIDKYIRGYSLAWEIEQKKSEDVRRAERNAMWVLWAQRMVRWTASAFAVVLIYSSMIWLSQECAFIKIPIKDWVIPHEAGKP